MLSILIPAYNAERYIGAALDSALSQQVDGGTEILVCDDGSTDRTADVVRAKMRNHPQLKLFSLGTNQGICATRNRLLAEVSPQAQFLAFLDADDVLVDDAYQPGLQILQAQPAAQMTYGKVLIVPSHHLSQGRPLAANPAPQPGLTLASGIFRKGLVDRVGVFDLSLKQGEDTDFLLRISEITKQIVLHDEPLFYYRRHRTNTTLNSADMRRGFLRVVMLHANRRKADPALFSGVHLFRPGDPAVMLAAMQQAQSTSYTVVIAAYDAAQTIVETLQSVLAQTVPPERIIVVNDGSTDDTAALAAAVSPLVQVITTPNRGSGAATTTGVAAVDTAIVATVDADDLWLPAKMEAQLAALLAGQGAVDAVLTRMQPFGDTHLKTAPVETSGWTRSTLVIWVDAFLHVGPVRDMGHGYGEMVDWFARAKGAGLRFTLLDDALAKRRIHAGSASFQADKGEGRAGQAGTGQAGTRQAGTGQAHDYLKVARLALERKRRQD